MEFDGYKYHNYISTDQDWLVIVSLHRRFSFKASPVTYSITHFNTAEYEGL